MDAAATKSALSRLRNYAVTVGEYLLMGLVVFYSSTWCLYTAANCNTALRWGVPLLVGLSSLRYRGASVALWRRVGLLAAYLAVYLLATRYNALRFLLYYVSPLLLLTLYTGWCPDGGEGLLHKLSDVVAVVAAVSLFFYGFGTVLWWIRPQIVTFYWGESLRICPTYFHLYYEAQQIEFLGWELPRNCGVFPEAPGFAVFLVVAVAAEVLLRARPRLWRCALFVTATLTTVSAKALLLTAAVFVLRYLLWPPVGWSSRRRVWLCSAVGGALVLAATVLLWDKLTSVSGAMRLDDAVACLRTFATAPLFGTGYWNDASVVPFFSYPDRYNNGLSVGAAVILAQGGLYLSALYGWAAADCVRRHRHRRRWAAFAVVYGGLLLSGNIVYHFLTLLLLAVFLSAGREECI